MTAIDTWIAQLQGNKGAQPSQPLISQVDVAVAALTLIATLLPSGGAVVAQGVLFGSTAATPVVAQSNKLSFDGSNLTINTGGVVTADAQLVVSANAVATLTAPVAGNVAHFVGASATQQCMITLDTFGTVGAVNYANVGSSIVCRAAGGTIGAPSNIAINRALGGLIGIGFGTTGYATTARAQISMYATEAWSDIAQGTYIAMYTTQATTLTTAQNFLLDGVGNLTVNGSLTSQQVNNIIASTNAMANHAGGGAGTLTNAPTAGNPTKWIQISDGGTARFIPCW